MSASTAPRPEPDLSVEVAGVTFGARHPLRVIAGPCSVEGPRQFLETALAVKQGGAALLRGGAFKPRTSPYSFQGLGAEGLRIMRQVADALGMGLVTEALAPADVPLVAEYADMVQIGARNMQNWPLLRRAASSGLPILLKRGIAATVDEVVDAANAIRANGNHKVIICERGSRTFEPATRNSVDIAAIPEMQLRTGLPVLVDPSHGTGRVDLVTPVALAGVAAGADGVMVEVHPEPSRALSDGPQSLEAAAFGSFMDRIRRLAQALGRT